eukprot:Selendium_serpulae@DN4679_c0_g1_i1.p1
MVVACVGYIGKQNQPLAIKVYRDEDEVSMQLAIYAAQDAIDHRAQDLVHPDRANPFLGNIGPGLCLSMEHRLYAYVTSTNVKIVTALEERNYHEKDVEEFLQTLYLLYTDAICNPFILDTIETPQFEERLRRTVETWSAQLRR